MYFYKKYNMKKLIPILTLYVLFNYGCDKQQDDIIPSITGNKKPRGNASFEFSIDGKGYTGTEYVDILFLFNGNAAFEKSKHMNIKLKVTDSAIITIGIFDNLSGWENEGIELKSYQIGTTVD